MNKKYIKGVVLLGVVLSMGLSSCNVLTKYEAPQADATDLFRDKNSTDTTSIANIPWREYFKDPILQSLIEEGLTNNFNLQMAMKRIDQAEASLGMARAAYFPSVALVGNVKHNRFSNGSNGKDVLGYHSNEYSLGIAATWELDLWGKMNRQSKAKYAQLLNSHAGRNLIQTSLISNIATSYYSLLALDEQLKITKETLALLEESANTMEALMEAGMLNGAAVQQSRAFLYGTQTSVPDLEMAIKQLENGLSLVVGRKPGTINRANFQKQAVPQQLSYGIPVQMLAKRPDVLQAELSFRSAFELKHAAQASFYPTITLDSGMLGFGAASISGFFKPENIFASIVGGLTQPIFARKQLTANLKIAKAEQEIALISFEQTVLTASREVSDILTTYESSLRKNQPRSKQIQSLKTSVEFTQELLKAGEANYTEVLTAEQNLLQAQLQQVNDKLEQLQASVNLYRALGGGVE